MAIGLKSTFTYAYCIIVVSLCSLSSCTTVLLNISYLDRFSEFCVKSVCDLKARFFLKSLCRFFGFKDLQRNHIVLKQKKIRN